MVIIILYIWWVVSTNPLKNHVIKVSWDDDIPNLIGAFYVGLLAWVAGSCWDFFFW